MMVGILGLLVPDHIVFDLTFTLVLAGIVLAMMILSERFLVGP